MLTKLSTFRGVTPEGDPLNKVFHPGDSIKVAGTMMPEIQEWLRTYKSDKENIAVLVNALGASEYYGINSNADWYSWAALAHDCSKHAGIPHPYDEFARKRAPEYGYKTFLNGHSFVHHANKNPERAIGKVVVAVLNIKMRRVELVVLINRAAAHKYGASHIVDRIDAGEYPDVSMGTRVAYDVCLLCGHKSKTRADYCSCMKIMQPTSILGDGRVVGVDNPHPRFFDISFVFIGADKTAKVMCKLGSGLWVPTSVIEAEILYGMSSDEEGLIKSASEDCGHKCGRCDNNSICDKFQMVKEASWKSHAGRAALGAGLGAAGGVAASDNPVTGALVGSGLGAVGGVAAPYLLEKGLARSANRKISRGRRNLQKVEDEIERHFAGTAAVRKIKDTVKANQEYDKRREIYSRMGKRLSEARDKVDYYAGHRAGLLSQRFSTPSAAAGGAVLGSAGGWLSRGKPEDSTKTASGDMLEYKMNEHNIKVGPPPKPNRKEFPFTGTVNYKGIKIHVENLRGSTREGTDLGGKKWSTKMLHHYGEIVGTRGVDKDKLDVYVGPEPNVKEVHIVHQNRPGNHPKAGTYDEDKVMLGFSSPEEAKEAYLAHYDRKDFFRSMTIMPFDQFKKSIYRDVKGEKVASDLESLFKVANGDEGRAPTAAEEKDIRDFISKTPQLSDKKFHAFLEGKGINPHKGEEVVYKVLRGETKKLEGGLADGEKPSKYNQGQLRKGIDVEFEHTNDRNVAREISMDHLEEIPDYYTRLHKMEQEAEKTSAVIPELEKIAIDMKLEDFFNSAKVAGRRERTWRNKVTGEETTHFGSGLGTHYETMQKTASIEKGASLAALKMAALKLADQSKNADIDKRINPEGTIGLVSQILADGEKKLPNEVMDEFGRGDLESGLTTPSMMGMVLRPGEFQRMLLTRVNRSDLADKFDKGNVRFAPVDGEIPPCESLGRHHFNHSLMKLLMPLIRDRSYLGPAVQRRIIRIRIVPKPQPEVLESSPLLDKISGAYNWYRREMMKVAADSEDLLSSTPELRAAVLGIEDEDLMKTAISGQTALVLGSVPVSLMYSSSIRKREQFGERLGVVEKLIADHPWVTSLGVAAGLRELMKNPSILEAAKKKGRELLD